MFKLVKRFKDKNSLKVMTQKVASNYKKSKIYKIVNNINNDCFIGGTCEDLNKKFKNYKRLFNNWLIKTNNQNAENSYNLFELRTTCNVVLYDNMFKKYGFDNCKIILLENYSCDKLSQLRLRVKHYTDTHTCLNTSCINVHENIDEIEYTYIESSNTSYIDGFENIDIESVTTCIYSDTDVYEIKLNDMD